MIGGMLNLQSKTLERLEAADFLHLDPEILNYVQVLRMRRLIDGTLRCRVETWLPFPITARTEPAFVPNFYSQNIPEAFLPLKMIRWKIQAGGFPYLRVKHLERNQTKSISCLSPLQQPSLTDLLLFASQWAQTTIEKNCLDSLWSDIELSLQTANKLACASAYLKFPFSWILSVHILVTWTQFEWLSSKIG